MLEKLNIRRIVADHFETLRYHDTGRYAPADFVVLFGVPLVPAGLIVWQRWAPDHGLVEVVVTAVSIVTGLLFNLLVLLYDQVGRPQTPAEEAGIRKANTRRKLLKETYQNVSFCVLVLLSSLVFLVGSHTAFPRVVRICAPIAGYLVGVAFLTLLMVLKRVHSLLSNEFDQPDVSPKAGG